MKAIQLVVTRIGNFKGIRLPAEVLRRYQVQNVLLLEQRPDEMALRPKRARRGKLTWAETYRQSRVSRASWAMFPPQKPRNCAASLPRCTPPHE